MLVPDWAPVKVPNYFMRITKVSFGATVNVGNFESVRIDMEAQVDENEDHGSVLARLKSLICDEANNAKTIARQK